LSEWSLGLLHERLARFFLCPCETADAPRSPLYTHTHTHTHTHTRAPTNRPGNLTITSSDSVPLIAPVGPYSMRMQAWDQSGAAVMCMDIWFKVVSAPSSTQRGSGSGGVGLELPGLGEPLGSGGGGWWWWKQERGGGGEAQAGAAQRRLEREEGGSGYRQQREKGAWSAWLRGRWGSAAAV